MPPNPSRLRGRTIPTDVWEFLDSNVPNLILNILRGYIEEVEKQNQLLSATNTRLHADIYKLSTRMDQLEDEIIRLKGERVTRMPVNTIGGTTNRTEISVVKRPYNSSYHGQRSSSYKKR